jgi:hypothetical protein
MPGQPQGKAWLLARFAPWLQTSAHRGYGRDAIQEKGAPPRLEWIGPERFHAACALFRKYADKEWSFADCVSFGTMRELRVREAFTTDHHFKQSELRSALEMNRCERLWNFV